MYNKDGKRLFFDRKDVLGKKPIGGAFAGVYINEDTIDRWMGAYENGLIAILDGNMDKLK